MQSLLIVVGTSQGRSPPAGLPEEYLYMMLVMVLEPVLRVLMKPTLRALLQERLFLRGRLTSMWDTSFSFANGDNSRLALGREMVYSSTKIHRTATQQKKLLLKSAREICDHKSCKIISIFDRLNGLMLVQEHSALITHTRLTVDSKSLLRDLSVILVIVEICEVHVRKSEVGQGIPCQNLTLGLQKPVLDGFA